MDRYAPSSCGNAATRSLRSLVSGPGGRYPDAPAPDATSCAPRPDSTGVRPERAAGSCTRVRWAPRPEPPVAGRQPPWTDQVAADWRRGVSSRRQTGGVSAGRVSATLRDGCSVFDSPASLHMRGSVGGAPIGRSEAGSRLPGSGSRQVMGGVRVRAWTANRGWQPTRGDAKPGGWEHGHRTANRHESGSR